MQTKFLFCKGVGHVILNLHFRGGSISFVPKGRGGPCVFYPPHFQMLRPTLYHLTKNTGNFDLKVNRTATSGISFKNFGLAPEFSEPIRFRTVKTRDLLGKTCHDRSRYYRTSHSYQRDFISSMALPCDPFPVPGRKCNSTFQPVRSVSRQDKVK